MTVAAGGRKGRPYDTDVGAGLVPALLLLEAPDELMQPGEDRVEDVRLAPSPGERVRVVERDRSHTGRRPIVHELQVVGDLHDGRNSEQAPRHERRLSNLLK
jgi:hypothetical protein